MVLNPEESAKSKKSKQFNGPTLADDHKGGSCKEANHYKPKVLFKMGSERFTEWAPCDCFAEVFIELISLFFVLIEQPCLKENSCDNQGFSEDSN